LSRVASLSFFDPTLVTFAIATTGNSAMLEEIGSSKIFTIADQSEFARLSGDHNSMHME
jgi:hypothetical protein